jgi:uncharacterized protein (TIGR04255 family)
VEAIFEVRWQLKEIQPGLVSDPNYSLLIGSLYQRLRQKYPFHQALPTALIPNEMVSGIVQHRFRKAKEKWPVVQLGPGIFTVNQTKGYTWVDFKQRVIEGVNALFETHPNVQELNIQTLGLRYINAIAIDFEHDDIFQFLKEQLKIDISLHSRLFEDTPVKRTPLEFDYKFSFACTKPKAIIKLRLARGKQQQTDALIWETIIETDSNGLPELPLQLEGWLEDAHDVIEDWFFKLIKGDLEKRFE